MKLFSKVIYTSLLRSSTEELNKAAFDLSKSISCTIFS